MLLVLVVAALLAGAVASVTGFGIGSLLTPLLASQTGMKLAVGAVTIPHLFGSAQRLWILRRHVDRKVLLGFGLTSAVGGLAGALAHNWISSDALRVTFGVIVAIAGLSELTGWIKRIHWGRTAGVIAGLLSGGLGGLVGNQGGIRTAAMLGFEVPRESFVATSAAIALFVDGARLPVYLTGQSHEIVALWPTLLALTVAVMVGTAIGARLLVKIPEQAFRRVLGVFLLLLGIYMVVSTSR